MLRVVSAMVALLLAGATAQAGPKAAIFPFELIDASLEGQYSGPRADEAERLKLATQELRRLVKRDTGYEVVDLRPLAPEIERSAPLYKCKECVFKLARRAGARVVITATVLKVSNLLLTFHIFVSDAVSGNLTKLWHVEVRGNTEESWRRGVRRLVADGLVGG